jgi:hypothetical protein
MMMAFSIMCGFSVAFAPAQRSRDPALGNTARSRSPGSTGNLEFGNTAYLVSTFIIREPVQYPISLVESAQSRLRINYIETRHPLMHALITVRSCWCNGRQSRALTLPDQANIASSTAPAANKPPRSMRTESVRKLPTAECRNASFYVHRFPMNEGSSDLDASWTCRQNVHTATLI